MKRVAGVQLTVTSPAEGLWTCMDDDAAAMAATNPDAAGGWNAREAGSVVAVVALAGEPALDEPPQAAIVTGSARKSSLEILDMPGRPCLCNMSSLKLSRASAALEVEGHSLRRASIGARRAARLAG
jgi:hypothetical protein